MKKKKEMEVPKSRRLLRMSIELAAQSERLVLLNEVGCVDDVIQVAEQLCVKLGNLIAFAKYTITCGTITGGDFYASSYVYDGDSVDRSCIICRNCFPTEERAEQVAEKMRFLLRLEQLHDMICPDYVPDYGDDETKYHIYFSHLQGKYNISCSTSWENPCMVAFDTKENALKATGILNKELEESK